MIRTDVYVHSCKETMWELGEKLGLKEVAMQMFRHAASEVKLTLEVDESTGLSVIVAVDDVPLSASESPFTEPFTNSHSGMGIPKQ